MKAPQLTSPRENAPVQVMSLVNVLVKCCGRQNTHLGSKKSLNLWLISMPNVNCNLYCTLSIHVILFLLFLSQNYMVRADQIVKSGAGGSSTLYDGHHSRWPPAIGKQSTWYDAHHKVHYNHLKLNQNVSNLYSKK